MDMATEIENVGSSIIKERKWGHTTFQVMEWPATSGGSDSITEVLDGFVEKLGFVGLEEGWREINRCEAETIAQIILHRDLAYRAEAMTAQRACKLAEQFLALFNKEARYFTNGEFDADGLHMWSGITEATFDTGIICIDNERMGILWVQDED